MGQEHGETLGGTSLRRARCEEWWSHHCIALFGTLHCPHAAIARALSMPPKRLVRLVACIKNLEEPAIFQLPSSQTPRWRARLAFWSLESGIESSDV